MSQITVIRRDAEAEELYIGRVDATNIAVPGAGSISLKLGDCAGEDLAIRLFKFKNSDDACKVYQMYILCSTPVLAP